MLTKHSQGKRERQCVWSCSQECTYFIGDHTRPLELDEVVCIGDEVEFGMREQRGRAIEVAAWLSRIERALQQEDGKEHLRVKRGPLAQYLVGHVTEVVGDRFCHPKATEFLDDAL